MKIRRVLAAVLVATGALHTSAAVATESQRKDLWFEIRMRNSWNTAADGCADVRVQVWVVAATSSYTVRGGFTGPDGQLVSDEVLVSGESSSGEDSRYVSVRVCGTQPQQPRTYRYRFEFVGTETATGAQVTEVERGTIDLIPSVRYFTPKQGYGDWIGGRTAAGGLLRYKIERTPSNDMSTMGRAIYVNSRSRVPVKYQVVMKTPAGTRVIEGTVGGRRREGLPAMDWFWGLKRAETYETITVRRAR